MADSQGLVKTSKNRQSIESSSFIYGEVHDIIASGYTSSPVEKEKQNYEATAPGNPRFLEQPIQIDSALIRSDHERSIKNFDQFWRGQLDGEEEENSKTFWFPVEEIQTVFNGDRTRLNIFIIISLLLLLFDFILLARSLR